MFYVDALSPRAFKFFKTNFILYRTLNIYALI